MTKYDAATLALLLILTTIYLLIYVHLNYKDAYLTCRDNNSEWVCKSLFKHCMWGNCDE